MTAHAPTTTSDVLVIGAGPTGLLLAGDLAAAGIAVTVLERRPPGISNLTRAFGVHARTLEHLDARGLADELVGTGTPARRLRLFGSLSLDLTHLRTRYPFLLITPQYEVERLLQRRAEEHGAVFRHGAEATGVRQDAEGAEVTTAEEGGATAVHRAAYAVGTDGHRSAVRRALGLPFPGKSVIQSMVLADVRLTDAPENLLTLNGVGDAFAFVAPYGDGWYRVGGWNRRRQVPDDAPVGLDELRTTARRALGDDYGMRDARWISRFHSDERQVPAYRAGRVLLAGDAAHVHSPAGGQGMNTGLQDAANLSWKLAAVLRGEAPDALLDTYHSERHPVGRTVLRTSGAILRMAMADSPAELAVRRGVTFLGGHVRPAADRMLGNVTGLGIAYGTGRTGRTGLPGRTGLARLARLAGLPGRGAHPLTGRRVPDLRLAPDTRLHEVLRAGRFVLVTPAGAAVPDLPDRVLHAHRPAAAGPTLLVRPDGYAAWVSDAPAPGDVGKALRTWPTGA